MVNFGLLREPSFLAPRMGCYVWLCFLSYVSTYLQFACLMTCLSVSIHHQSIHQPPFHHPKATRSPSTHPLIIHVTVTHPPIHRLSALSVCLCVMPAWMSACLLGCLSEGLPCLSVCLPCLSVCLPCLFVCLLVCLSVLPAWMFCLFVCLPCLFIYLPAHPPTLSCLLVCTKTIGFYPREGRYPVCLLLKRIPE